MTDDYDQISDAELEAALQHPDPREEFEDALRRARRRAAGSRDHSSLVDMYQASNPGASRQDAKRAVQRAKRIVTHAES
jgi:hypothetical protein